MGHVCGKINILILSDVKFVVYAKPVTQPNITFALLVIHRWHMRAV